MTRFRASNGQKPHIIQDILVELTAHTRQTDIFKKYKDQWQISLRTFTRYLKEAYDIHEQGLLLAQKEIEETRVKLEKQRIRKAVITKKQVLKRLLKIADTAKRDADKTNALRLICDIEGYKAPIQREVEVTHNTPIFFENPLLNGIQGPTNTTIDIPTIDITGEAEPDQPTQDSEPNPDT